MKWTTFICRTGILLVTACTLSACDITPVQDDENSVQSGNRLNWASVPPQYHPTVEDITFSLTYQTVNVDVFGFESDVEVVYSDDETQNGGILRMFKVWNKFASFGNIHANSKGTALDLMTSGSYKCAIEIENGGIKSLEGGCYVRLQVFLPRGSDIQIYNAGRLISSGH